MERSNENNDSHEKNETENCPHNLNGLEVYSIEELIISHRETQKLFGNKFLPLNPPCSRGLHMFPLAICSDGVPLTPSLPIWVLPSPMAQLNFAPPQLFP